MLRNGSKKQSDPQILATQLVDEKIVSLNPNGMLSEWDLKTGKLIQIKKEPNLIFPGFTFHQFISKNQIMIKRIKEKSIFKRMESSIRRKL
mmetsp:Transcript_29193/g.28255  ORF Transcript_29193/g.28255 Transcript_29193/m.28255 type:complete len:91 (-) Transcript_29193:366-638(-)